MYKGSFIYYPFLCLISFCLASLISCSPKLNSSFILHQDELDELGAEADELEGMRSRRCMDPSDYFPDSTFISHFALREIKVNFHIMNSLDSSQNFKGIYAINYLESLLRDANLKMGKNTQMNLPEGNDTRVFEPHYRYVLTPSTNEKNDKGIYFHYDDELYYFINKGRNKNNHKRDVIEKYAINKDSVLNIFVMPHHPDSIASPTYKAFGTGIALGSAIKIAGLHESGAQAWAFSTMLNHEIGHVLGLRHTYLSEDGCDDTPRNANCWYSSGTPPCEGPTSNNMMDYNNSQLAISPCQLGTIHRNIALATSRQRKLIIPTWCDLKEEKTILIDSRIHWLSSKDLEGHLVVKEKAELYLSCRVSFPAGGRLILEPGARLILDDALLHNSCGDFWNGIELQKKGKKQAEIIIQGNPKIENVQQIINQGY